MVIILENLRFVIPRGRSQDYYFFPYGEFPNFEIFAFSAICELEIFSSF